MHFDAYRIKSEEWHTGTRINIKLILTIPYNNDDVDMDPSMGLVSNTKNKYRHGLYNNYGVDIDDIVYNAIDICPQV